jgi:hypothetical protein
MPVGEAGATAQEAYRLMLREHIAPALRELEFRWVPSATAFRYATEAHAAEVWFTKSRYSTRREVIFSVGLVARDIDTDRLYWDYTLNGLAHHRGSWRIEAGTAGGPVASSVLRAFRGYGWPAIQAALDNPGYPPDPAVRWARTFPTFSATPEGNATMWRARSELYHTSQWRRNDPFAMLEILEKDPNAGEREDVAGRLIPWASTAEVSQALRSAAAEDEDVRVRWAARYALRLADQETPAGRQTAPPPVGQT